jgi:hypothetical protein
VLAYVGLAFLLTFAALALASIWLLDKTWSPLWHRLHARELVLYDQLDSAPATLPYKYQELLTMHYRQAANWFSATGISAGIAALIVIVIALAARWRPSVIDV